jgi:hypothetical protein
VVVLVVVLGGVACDSGEGEGGEGSGSRGGMENAVVG